MLKNVIRTFSRMSQPYVPTKRTQFLKSNPLVKGRFMCSHSESEDVPFESLLPREVLEKLSSGDEAKRKKLKLIEFECEFWKQEGKLIPSKIKEKEWSELLSLETRSSRLKFLDFLFKREKIREHEKAKKLESKIKLEQLREERVPEKATDDPHHYGINFNTLFLRLYNSKIDHFNNSKCINAIMFGLPLIFDLGFDKDLTPLEQRATAKQLAMVFHVNRIHDEPFNLQFLNCNVESLLMKSLHSHIPVLHEPDFPITVSSQNYLDLYPKEKLVYLTPHTNNIMKKFDNDRVYIIGGIVDRSNNLPLTLAKAKRENIEMAKFPLENYLSWGASASKMLTLDAVVNILLEMKTSGDWNKAFAHIPRRKLKSEEEMLVENQMRAMKESRGRKFDRTNTAREPSGMPGQFWKQRPVIQDQWQKGKRKGNAHTYQISKLWEE